MANEQHERGAVGSLFRGVVILLGAALAVVFVFCLMLFIQAITKEGEPEKEFVQAEAFEEPPPPKIEEPDPPKDEEDEDVEPPSIELEVQPLSFDQLDISGSGTGSGWGGANLVSKLDIKGKAGGDGGFNLKSNQKPRPIFQAQPTLRNSALKKQVPATVVIAFIVDAKGRVTRPKVKSSTNSAFNRSALAAIKKWKFQPGKRDGKVVGDYRMKVPITFPRSQG